MKISRWLLAGAVVLGLGAALALYWQTRTPPEIVAARKLGAELSQKGREGVPACVSCHGAQGEGNAAAGFPRLAGLHAGYLARQLRDFGRDAPLTGAHFDKIARDYSKTPRINLPYSLLTPGLRQDPVMSPIAKALKPGEIEALAQYYAALPFVAKSLAGDPETLERGEDLALRGKPEYGVPGCFSCHGQNAVGVGAVFPALAGQPPQYIIEQLNRWQAGTRDNDENGLMRAVAEWMTEGDKQAIAAYLANLSDRAGAR
jgi:cytochrome c553